MSFSFSSGLTWLRKKRKKLHLKRQHLKKPPNQNQKQKKTKSKKNKEIAGDSGISGN